MRKTLVTHLCYSASAQTAAFRLHHALQQEKISSKMITGARSINDVNLTQPTTILERLSSLFPLVKELLIKKILRAETFPPYSFNLGHELFQKIWLHKFRQHNSKIVHLHWIGNGFIPIKRLSKFTEPIVWTIHDTWPFTAGCHILRDCEGYTSNCQDCPALPTIAGKLLASYAFKQKKKAYEQTSLNIVAPSNWIAEQAKKSPLLKGRNISIIPNPIDTDTFKPADKTELRRLLNLPLDGQVIAFGAISPFSDPNKGFKLLTAALDYLREKLNPNTTLLVFGGDAGNELIGGNFKIKSMGRLHDDSTLNIVYNCANVVVVPSRQETFSQVAAEALASGTPVVAFDSTGPKDIVDHLVNGYLAKSYEIEDLAQGILWVLSHTSPSTLCTNARNKALHSFSYPKVAQMHKELYSRILNGN